MDWVEGELVARRTLPGAGGEEDIAGLCVGERGWWNGELGYLVAGRMGMLEAMLSVMRISKEEVEVV